VLTPPKGIPLQRLVALAQDGLTLAQIGNRVGLHETTVSQRLRRAGYAIAALRNRSCSRCERVLQRSDAGGPQTRVCGLCAERAKSLSRDRQKRVALRTVHPPHAPWSIAPAVREAIVALEGTASQRAVAAQFGVAKATVGRFWREAVRA
jgi:hypothetical protein